MTPVTGPGTAANASAQNVVFVQKATPPLRDGKYVLSVTQTIPDQSPGQPAPVFTYGEKWTGPSRLTATATASFVVSGERFTIRPAEIDSVFPPDHANGEFAGVLAHVVFNRRTLPWERTIDTPNSANCYPDSPWLAVLVCDDEAPEPTQVTAKDLVPDGRDITVQKDLVPDDTDVTVQESTVTGTGTLPSTTLSYGADLLGQLAYGETPSDPCTVIDLPIAMFNKIAPAAADLQYLAHVRVVDTSDGRDSTSPSEQHAVVVANRVPSTQGGVTRAFLVSLEGMADYLPKPDGTLSDAIAVLKPPIVTVRLIVYRSWTFSANDMGEALKRLLENLNVRPGGGTPITTLALPIAGDPPSARRVAQAVANQADGRLLSEDARILMQNALLMGYVPAEHHLRHGGRTVSFYRGPFVPLAVPAAAPAYYSGPDAASAYDPQTGMFDVSYGAAWQLGQLLALQNSGLANQLYQWKRTVVLHQAIAAEEELLTRRLGGAEVLSGFLAPRRAAAGSPPLLPGDVLAWFANLAVLEGVPFNYLVPDEHMLPPESIRFFHVDQNWIDALIDGAFSIGRTTVSEQSLEATHAPVARALARSTPRRRAVNRPLASSAAAPAPVSGFLLRSQAVAGWPNLRVKGYRDTGAAGPVTNTVRIAHLSSDTMLCLFDGIVASMSLQEPPEQLHHGVEGPNGGYYTTLRSVTGGPEPVKAGQEYSESSTPPGPDGTSPWQLSIPMRADGRTIDVAPAATRIRDRLFDVFRQEFPNDFTAAEFALELTMGVVEVEFTR